MALPERIRRQKNLFDPAQTALEQHFTIREISEKWHLSKSLVHEIFRDEPGVIRRVSNTKGKRTYGLLRVPESVMKRVYSRMAI